MLASLGGLSLYVVLLTSETLIETHPFEGGFEWGSNPLPNSQLDSSGCSLFFCSSVQFQDTYVPTYL